MAESDLTVTEVEETKVWVNASTGGHSYSNNGRTRLFIQNSTGSTHTLQHTEQRVCDFGHAAVNPTNDIATATTEEIWVAKDVRRFNDASGKAHLTFTTDIAGEIVSTTAASMNTFTFAIAISVPSTDPAMAALITASVPGHFWVEEEKIGYTSIWNFFGTAVSFAILTRGIDGTTETDHSSGATLRIPYADGYGSGNENLLLAAVDYSRD
jgi:hypothetical protein